MKSEKDTNRKSAPRVALSVRAKEIIDGWHSRLKERFGGIKVTDGDLVNWCLGKQNETLSKEDFSALESQYFDAVRQLEWLLAEARAKKAKGELPVTPKKPSVD